MTGDRPGSALPDRYLLGRLSEEEAEAFEDRFIEDDELFDTVRAAETDLLDEYVRGELGPPEREAFARRLASSPSLAARLESARAIRDGLREVAAPAESATRRRGPVGWPLGLAAAVLVGVVGVRFGIETSRLREEISAAQSSRARVESENRALREQLASEKARAAEKPAPAPQLEISPGAAVSLRLAPGLLRDLAGHNDFRVPANAAAALLEVPVEGRPNATFSISIETPEGVRVLEQRRLVPVLRGKTRYVVTATAPGSLPAGDYLLRVSPEPGTSGGQAANFAFRLSYN